MAPPNGREERAPMLHHIIAKMQRKWSSKESNVNVISTNPILEQQYPVSSNNDKKNEANSDATAEFVNKESSARDPSDITSSDRDRTENFESNILSHNSAVNSTPKPINVSNALQALTSRAREPTDATVAIESGTVAQEQSSVFANEQVVGANASAIVVSADEPSPVPQSPDHIDEQVTDRCEKDITVKSGETSTLRPPSVEQSENALEGSSSQSQSHASTNNKAQVGKSNEIVVVVNNEEISSVSPPPEQKLVEKRRARAIVPSTHVPHSYGTRSKGAVQPEVVTSIEVAPLLENKKKRKSRKKKKSSEAPPSTVQAKTAPKFNTTATSSNSSEVPLHDGNCFICKLIIKEGDESPCTTCHLNYHKKCAKKNNSFSKVKSVWSECRKLHPDTPEDQLDAGIRRLHLAAERGNVCNKCSLIAADNYFTNSKDGVKRTNALKVDVETSFSTLAYLLTVQCKPPNRGKGATVDFKPFLIEPKITEQQKGLIARHMTLEAIKVKGKATNKADQYNSAAELIFDLEIFLHNRIVLSNCDKVVKEKSEQLLKFAKKEAFLINACDSCYRMYYKEKNVPRKACCSPFRSSLLLPCQQPHSMVWYKLGKREVWWPAIVYPYYGEYRLAIDESKMWVFPFGHHKERTIRSDLLYSYSLNPPRGTSIRFDDKNQLDALIKAQYYATHQNDKVTQCQVPRDAFKFVKGDFFFEKKKQGPNEKNLPKGEWECCINGCGENADAAFHMVVQSFCTKEHRKEFLKINEGILKDHPQYTKQYPILKSRRASVGKRGRRSSKK